MRHIERSGNFKRNAQLMWSRGKKQQLLFEVIETLVNDHPLPAAKRDHPLLGLFKGFRECHIQPDWLLIYKKLDSEDGRGILYLEATGSHADLF